MAAGRPRLHRTGQLRARRRRAGIPLDDAIDHCERWYAERGQTTMFQVNGPVGFTIAHHPVAHALVEQGYTIGGRRTRLVRVLVATGLAGIPPRPTAHRTSSPTRRSPRWLRAYGEGRTRSPGSRRRSSPAASGDCSSRSGRTRTAGSSPWRGSPSIRLGRRLRTLGPPRPPAPGSRPRVMAAVGTIAREPYRRSTCRCQRTTTARSPSTKSCFTVHHEYTYLVQRLAPDLGSPARTRRRAGPAAYAGLVPQRNSGFRVGVGADDLVLGDVVRVHGLALDERRRARLEPLARHRDVEARVGLLRVARRGVVADRLGSTTLRRAPLTDLMSQCLVLHTRPWTLPSATHVCSSIP